MKFALFLHLKKDSKRNMQKDVLRVSSWRDVKA